MLRKPRVLGAAGVVVLGGLVAFLSGRTVTAPAGALPSSEAGARSISSPARAVAPVRAAWLAPGPTAPDEPTAKGDLEGRRARLEHTLASYLDWARYPPGSRPARERPDRTAPHASSPRRLPLAAGKGKRTAARVVLSQSHVYLAGEERATLTVACERDGAPVSCAVRGAVATSDLPEVVVPLVPLLFADDGRGADRQAGDGALSARFAPGAQGFAGFTGPVRIALDVEAGGERGGATFVLAYTSDAPATFTGAVRERLAGGSVEVCLEMRVREAGRHLIDGRVDDATGETFAFVTFDGELGEGTGEACFEIFGKLVRDEQAEAPFTLRDVEGLRLLEDTFPDRRTVPTWEGRVHTTRRYTLGDLANQPWESEDKDRRTAALRARLEATGEP